MSWLLQSLYYFVCSLPERSGPQSLAETFYMCEKKYLLWSVGVNKHLFELILHLWHLEVTSLCLNVIHVAGTQLIHQGSDGLSCWKKAYLLRTLCGCTFLYTWQPIQGTQNFSTGSNLSGLPPASAPWLLKAGSGRLIYWSIGCVHVTWIWRHVVPLDASTGGRSGWIGGISNGLP